MEKMTPITDVQRLYEQWQEGKLLDKEERQALSTAGMLESTQSFAEVLKATSETEPAS